MLWVWKYYSQCNEWQLWQIINLNLFPHHILLLHPIYDGCSLESKGSVYFILCITFFVLKRSATIHCLVQQKASVLAYIECVTDMSLCVQFLGSQRSIVSQNVWKFRLRIWCKCTSICILYAKYMSTHTHTHAHTICLSVIVNMK